MSRTSASADGVWQNLRIPDFLADTLVDAAQAASIAVQDGRIAWVGAGAALPQEFDSLPRFDGRGAWATPGLVDCHTHLVYGGNRANEFALRLAGASYEDIARAGGGIVSTVRATRAADEEALYQQSAARLAQLLDEGVCAIEIKSGYGLALEHERRQLRVARRLGRDFNMTVRATFLGAHALPPEYAEHSGDYIGLVCGTMLPALAKEGLVDAIDVFCDRIGFTLAETEKVFATAQRLGVPVKLHAEQLRNMHSAALAARFGALSCDHLEYLDDEGIAAMKQAGTVAVLLPGAYYTLGDSHPPPVARLRAAEVPMAVSTDHNPGSSPTLSLLLMANMACTLFGLTVPEALAGITRHAARALGLQDTHGAIGAGRPANFVLWGTDELAELAYRFGQQPRRTIVRNGVIARDDLTCAA